MTPDREAVAALRGSWEWRLGTGWSPLLFSVFGDVFLERAGEVHRLDTGTADLKKVAADEGAFRGALGGEQVDDWFLPLLVEQLHRAGRRPGLGECFTYVVYPIFAEGRFEVGNFAVVPARDHFILSGDLHRQLADVNDGERVRLRFEP